MTTKTTEKPVKEISPAKQELIFLSSEVRSLVDSGQYQTINRAIICEFYHNTGNTEFQSLWQWNKLGKRVKKGAKAFTLWGKPRYFNVDNDGNYYKVNTEDEEEMKEALKAFPLAYVFGDLQVEEITQ
jgi:hypothetical protein